MNNQNSTAGYKPQNQYFALSASASATAAGYIRRKTWSMAGRGQQMNHGNKPKENVLLHPGDVQDIVMDADNGQNEEGDNESEQVLMNDDDRNIYNKFHETMSRKTVEIT